MNTRSTNRAQCTFFGDIIQFTDQVQSCEINPGNGTKHSMTNNDKAKTHPELSGPRGKSMFLNKIKSATYKHDLKKKSWLQNPPKCQQSIALPRHLNHYYAKGI